MLVINVHLPFMLHLFGYINLPGRRKFGCCSCAVEISVAVVRRRKCHRAVHTDAHTLLCVPACVFVCVRRFLYECVCVSGGVIGVWRRRRVSHQPLYVVGSAWHREVSGDSDDIIPITFFRCGSTLLASSSPSPPSPPSFCLSFMHFRPAFL